MNRFHKSIAALSLCSIVSFCATSSFAQEHDDAPQSQEIAVSEDQTVSGDESKDSSFSYIGLYDIKDAGYIAPPAYPMMDYYSMMLPDVTHAKDVGVAPPVYPNPEKDES